MVTVQAMPGKWKGMAELTKVSGKKVTCKGLRHSIDYDRATVVASIPRSCLGNPKWVKVGVQSGSTSDFNTFYLDDALTNGTVGLNPKVGPKVKR